MTRRLLTLAIRHAAPWLPLITYTIVDGARARHQHRSEPPNIYNQGPRTYGHGWRP